MKFLGTLPGGTCESGYCSWASQVNDRDQIVGAAHVHSDPTHQEDHGFLWSRASGMQDLGPFAASHINNRGTVLGGQPNRWYIWSKATGYTVVPLFFPELVNDDDVVLGLYADPVHQGQSLVTWTRTGGIGPSLNIDPASVNTPVAYDFNNKGEIAGWSPSFDYFFWSPVSGTQSIPPLSGAHFGVTAMNNLGQVVGGDGSTALFWSASTGTQDLNALIPHNPGISLYYAADINDAGQILATSFVTLQPSGWHLRVHILSPLMKVSLSSAGPAASGVKFPITASVTSAQAYLPKDGEMVTFKLQGGTTIGRAHLKQGVARAMVSLPAGSYSIQAYYAGDENYAASHSPALLQIVK